MSEPGELRVEHSDADRRPVRVALHGDLDYAHDRELADALAKAVAGVGAGDELVVDLAGVPYFDSCGLRALLGAAQRVEARGGRFALRGVTGQPGRVLRLTGLDAVMGDDAAP